MAYMFVRITVPSAATTNLNTSVTDSTKPHEGVNLLIDLLEGIVGGAENGEVDVYVSNTDESLSAQNGGVSASYNLK